MGKLVIEIPEEVAAGMNLPEAEKAERLRREVAVRLYEKGILDFGPARRLSGLTRWDFHNLLGREGVVRSYDQEAFEDDLRAIEGLP